MIVHDGVCLISTLCTEKDLRGSIRRGTFDTFVRDFMLQQFPSKNYPQWTVEALLAAGIALH